MRIFCDADVLIAGAASTRGASHILLQLSELTLIACLTSPRAIQESERNLAVKLPRAVPPFRRILEVAVERVPDAAPTLEQEVASQADPKDVPILAAAIACGADFLATFNVRHFQVRSSPPLIARPGRIVAAVRSSLARISTKLR